MVEAWADLKTRIGEASKSLEGRTLLQAHFDLALSCEDPALGEEPKYCGKEWMVGFVQWVERVAVQTPSEGKY